MREAGIEPTTLYLSDTKRSINPPLYQLSYSRINYVSILYFKPFKMSRISVSTSGVKNKLMENIVHTLEDLDNLKRGEQPTIQCSCCGKIFKRDRTIVYIALKRNNANFYCSKECQIKFKTGKSHTSNEKVLNYLNCKNCNKPIERRNGELKKVKNSFCCSSCAAKFNNRLKKKEKPVKIKREEIVAILKTPKIKIRCLCFCEQCGKEILKTKRDLTRKIKNGLSFCSRSCRMTHQNLNTKNKYSCRRSKAEEYLCQLISVDFKDMEILKNDRTILPSKLELDIYIPSLKLAIELNGPTHYLPIFGESKLNRTVRNDERKNLEMIDLEINALTIDISHLNSSKKTKEFLDKVYKDKIKDIISEIGSGFRVTRSKSDYEPPV